MIRSLSTCTLLFCAACNGYSYVSLMAGDWAGTATDAAAGLGLMSASFTYDDEEEEYPFDGYAVLADYKYLVYEASSDKDGATISMLSELLNREMLLTNVVVEDEQMSGDYTVNICYGQEGADPAACNFPGSFDLDLQ